MRAATRVSVALLAGGLLLAAFLLPSAHAHAASAFSLVPVASGLESPVYVAQPIGDPRLFVVERPGRIRLVRGGRLATRPFADLTRLVDLTGERGMLSIAFHPRFGRNGRLFAAFATQSTVEVVELHARPGAAAVDGSTRTILSIPHPRSTHNGGQLQFGRDGFLYISTGDGGGSGDPDRNAQRRTSLLGKLLRIDIDRPPFAAAYRIPLGNPYVGVPPWRAEVIALGLRNPWRFSFDRATGDLWLGDVGQDRLEEIDRVPRNEIGGANFGWSRFEGTERFGERAVRGGHLVRPAATYPHTLGCSVIGGYVYRGPAIAGLSGQYVFGDFCSARIWTIDAHGGPIVEVGSGIGFGATEITSFGQGTDGTLYLTSARGGMYRFAPST